MCLSVEGIGTNIHRADLLHVHIYSENVVPKNFTQLRPGVWYVSAKQIDSFGTES